MAACTQFAACREILPGIQDLVECRRMRSAHSAGQDHFTGNLDLDEAAGADGRHHITSLCG